MKITKEQYKVLDKLQHLWREVQKQGIDITVRVNNITNADSVTKGIIFSDLEDFTKAVINTEQNEKLSLLEIK